MMRFSQSSAPTIEAIVVPSVVEIRLNVENIRNKEGYPFVRFLYKYKNNPWEEQDGLYIAQLFPVKDIQISHDDKYLLIVSDYHVYLIDLTRPFAQRRQRILTEDPHDCAFSPNTRMLWAYNCVKHHLAVFHLDTGRRQIIARDGAFFGGWYPDSRHIWYLRTSPPGEAFDRDRGASRRTAWVVPPQGYRQDRSWRLLARLPAHRWAQRSETQTPEGTVDELYEYNVLTGRRRVLSYEELASRWDLLNSRFRYGSSLLNRDGSWYGSCAYSQGGTTRLVATELLDRKISGSPWSLKVEWRDGRTRSVWQAGSHDWQVVEPVDVSDDGEWALVKAYKFKPVETEFGLDWSYDFHAYLLVNTRTRQEEILIRDDLEVFENKGWYFVDGPSGVWFWKVVRLRFVYPTGARR
uniref:Uncharacterized protein n=1 Tax=uncultured prokaryote TaxID=198431 RepID=H5S9I0_9ZZZZ|nr:hypothetical protein HGMM_F03C06C21 [uncultured prokaryote]